MPYAYAVLGAGRQGVAAAYDMARWGAARRILLADRDPAVARRAVERVNALVGEPVAEPVAVDVTDPDEVVRALNGLDAFLSAVPYVYNLGVARAAIRAGVHMCDLGGHTTIAREQHALDAQARAAGISIVPNCGQVPGMGTSLMVYAMERLDDTAEVYMWDGGLPQCPRPPFQYQLTFNVAGLTNEYAEKAVFIRDGKVTEVEPLTELEVIDFPEPIGRLEAFVTGGGTDSMPWIYEGRVRTLQNKTLRHPGHFAQLRAYYDLGLWGTEPIRVADAEVVPRDVWHALFEPRVTFPDDRDLIVLRVKAVGSHSGRRAVCTVELIDRFDEATDFTAMERTTGWSAAIVTEMAARGQIPIGSAGVATQVPSQRYVEELRRRGIHVTEEVTIQE
jgi:lysine 6-dehydrogenase